MSGLHVFFSGNDWSCGKNRGLDSVCFSDKFVVGPISSREEYFWDIRQKFWDTCCGPGLFVRDEFIGALDSVREVTIWVRQSWFGDYIGASYLVRALEKNIQEPTKLIVRVVKDSRDLEAALDSSDEMKGYVLRGNGLNQIRNILSLALTEKHLPGSEMTQWDGGSIFDFAEIRRVLARQYPAIDSGLNYYDQVILEEIDCLQNDRLASITSRSVAKFFADGCDLSNVFVLSRVELFSRLDIVSFGDAIGNKYTRPVRASASWRSLALSKSKELYCPSFQGYFGESSLFMWSDSAGEIAIIDG